METQNTHQPQLKSPAPSGAGIADRFKVRAISALAYWIIRILGSTWRWANEGQEYFEKGQREWGAIYVFWHGRIIPAICRYRDEGIVVMISQHRDGEYTSRVIRRFGFKTARGSSTRGARNALLEMMRQMKEKASVAITIDGPRGPRYVSKPGAVWLAAKTGKPIIPFTVAAEKKWELKTWDHTQIPRPFTRVVAIMSPPIWIKSDATAAELEETQKQVQTRLEQLLVRGDTYWNRQESRKRGDWLS